MYWAKPDELYQVHIQNCYAVWEKLSEENEHLLVLFAQRHNIPYSKLREKIVLAILFHDVGKLLPVFQKNMELIRMNKKPDYSKNFRHELISAVFLWALYISRLKNDSEEKKYLPFEIYAVLGHHKELEPMFSSFDRELKCAKWPGLERERVNYAIGCISPILEKEKLVVDKKSGISVFEENHHAKLLKYLKDIVSSSKLYQRNTNNHLERQIFSLIKGIVCYCDWYASAHTEVKFLPDLTAEGLLATIKMKLAKEKKQFEIRPFHQKCMEASEDALVIAPTGSGKTEAALFWALKNKPKNIIFLMPTMVTSNSLFERIAENYFGKKYCGLTHSGVQTYMSLNEHAENTDIANLRLSLLHNKAFLPPVMVATVDQIISSGFNTGYWHLKEKALLGSAVIIDEVHAYDSHTLALITETIKKIKDFNGKVMIMSATMPKKLREHFKSILPSMREIIAHERMELRRNNWKYLDLNVQDIREVIEEKLDGGKRVALVVNDIETAKAEYDYYSEKLRDKKKAMCYHSEFIMLDRLEKERILTKGKDEEKPDLLISTQTIEVSLDVSFDVMFSECAPLDALIQRAGRCNRYNKNDDAEFIVFNYSERSYMYVYKRCQSILQRSLEVIRQNQGKLSENDLAVMLEQVYSHQEILDEDYIKASKIYKQIEEDEFIFDIPLSEEKTRNFDYIKVPIIPIEFKDEVEELYRAKRFEKIPLYEVPVGIYKYKGLKNRKQQNEFNLPIYCVEYSSQKGIDFAEVESSITCL